MKSVVEGQEAHFSLLRLRRRGRALPQCSTKPRVIKARNVNATIIRGFLESPVRGHSMKYAEVTYEQDTEKVLSHVVSTTH